MLNGLPAQGTLRRVTGEASGPAAGLFAGVNSSLSLSRQSAQSDKRDGLARIASAFATARAEGRAALMPYFTLGYPDIAASEVVVRAIAAAGADLIELGVPFSDPLADGPTIQHSTQVALEQGMSLTNGLVLTGRLRAAGVTQPLLLMGYVNPILAYGVSSYVADAAAAGADGFIVPDLPPEEAGEFEAACRAHGLALSSCWRRPPPRNASLRWSATRRASSIWCRWRASPARGTNCRPTWPRSSAACAARQACRWQSDSASPPPSTRPLSVGLLMA